MGSAAPGRPRPRPLWVPAARAPTAGPGLPSRSAEQAATRRSRPRAGAPPTAGAAPRPTAPRPGSPCTLPALGGRRRAAGRRWGWGARWVAARRCPPVPALPSRCEDTLRLAPASGIRGSCFRRPGRSRVRAQPGGLLPASAACPAGVRAGEGAHAGPCGEPGEPTL